MRRTLIMTVLLMTATGQTAWLTAGPAAAAARPRVTPAASSALLYDYHFAGTKGTVGNSAPGGPAVSLKLHGSWSAVPGGVHFSGNTTGQASVAAGKPGSGDTIDAPATDAVGFGARIQYQQPATGSCFTGTPNVTQVGRFSVHEGGGQAKLQLSNCGAGHQHVYVQCRFDGSASKSSTRPVTGTTPLVNGAEYALACLKAPDSQHHTVITVQVTRMSSGATSKSTFTAGAVGSLQSTAYLSAGNKYHLPKPAHNTSQFVGNMSRAVYCIGPLTQVQRCLAANLTS
jgi:hypothetical protein